ncbi:hypothetical protein FRACYDRAFT_260331 [Fragilariopsis cylindrus CCMP1102]|uniref:Uncharacterized protein n=1 Tax=Fragilariopsis cylindrus CCMP1102 TaxID=635003 RepID=A0A1E7FJH2_9STRA|nr:hypothetical protein FRACYDRAFT_260331 [Fragilariopsis cylindrus CCMP1102]|eukprot:OEU18274.1 hypothetical protein FRACYDRAFT_260331 [Fragilariopsis cylindrus CCMP1102]
MNASQVLVILLLELLFITIISHAFIILPTITTLHRPVVVRSINEVGILSNKFGTTSSTRSALDALESESELDDDDDDDDASSSDNKLTLKEKSVYTMLKELSNSNLLFRIVVVGNGAILESTNLLGMMKLNQSPVSGANIVTFASNNQSFEFHLMIGHIDKVAFIEKDSPINKGKTMRIIRFINDESGKSICSLILATSAAAATSAADGVDDDDDAIANDWFKVMISKYGSEHTFLN